MNIEGKRESLPLKIEIGLGRPEDVMDIQEVFKQAWLATYPNEEHGIRAEDIEERYKNALDPEIIEKRAELLRNPPINEFRLVAKDKGRVVGAAFGSKGEEHSRLNALYVLPEYHRKGIGLQLWNEAQKYFEKDQDIRLGVADYNQNAIDFYTSLGFEDTGERLMDERLRLANGAIIPQREMVLRKAPEVPKE